MGYSVRIWGDFSLSTAQAGAWRELRADASAWDDWAGDFVSLAEPRRVGEMLDAYVDWPGGDDEPEHLSVRVGEGRCAVRGFVDEGSFRELASTLGALFRSAQAVGARGEVTFAADTGEFAYRLALDESATRFFRPLGEDLVRASDLTAQKELETLLGARARCKLEAKAARASAGAPGLVAEIFEALEEATPASLRIASSKMTTTTSAASGGLKLFKAFKDGAVLRDELRNGSAHFGPNEQAQIAIELLCRVNMERGFRLAARALEASENGASSLQVGAVRGLALTGHRLALTLLLAAVTSHDGEVALAASQALVMFDHPEVDRVLQTALDGWNHNPRNADRRSFLAEAQRGRAAR